MSSSLKEICGNCGKHCGEKELSTGEKKLSTNYPQEKKIKMGAEQERLKINIKLRRKNVNFSTLKMPP